MATATSSDTICSHIAGIIRLSKVSDNYINSNNIDAHAFKNQAGKIPKSQISKYDIYKDTANKGKLWVGDKAGKVWRETTYFFKDLMNLWRKNEFE